MQEMWVRFLGQGDPLEKELSAHSSVLAWEILWTEEPDGLQSMGLQELDTTQWLNSKSKAFTKGPLPQPVSSWLLSKCITSPIWGVFSHPPPYSSWRLQFPRLPRSGDIILFLSLVHFSVFSINNLFLPSAGLGHCSIYFLSEDRMLKSFIHAVSSNAFFPVSL